MLCCFVAYLVLFLHNSRFKKSQIQVYSEFSMKKSILSLSNSFNCSICSMRHTELQYFITYDNIETDSCVTNVIFENILTLKHNLKCNTWSATSSALSISSFLWDIFVYLGNVCSALTGHVPPWETGNGKNVKCEPKVKKYYDVVYDENTMKSSNCTCSLFLTLLIRSYSFHCVI